MMAGYSPLWRRIMSSKLPIVALEHCSEYAMLDPADDELLDLVDDQDQVLHPNTRHRRA